ncbi:glycosyltransferase [Providencia sp. wls1922]|uniref:Glycosyltransferase n=1 Tax=Providencia alcalifaciens TaxID=126385 RepID=H9XTS0_9GAMM|nr:glycosyltransferase [Providencia alcalifaciens]MTC44439.1 glycosyltransferase [Providencia sp. wls1922]
MKLTMLYSTLEDGLTSLIENLPSPNKLVNIIIIHQMNENKNYDDKIKILLNSRSDIQYYKSYTRGVAISRNIAINKSNNSDIILFCDDDVIYTNKFQEEILKQYEKNPTAGFITFSYSNNLDMKDLAPKFSTLGFVHTLRSILRVGTIEVTARRNMIIENKIKFPEDMGAGAKYFLCDEPVFLSQFLKKNIRGIYCPFIIGYHPAVSSGQKFNRIEAFASRYLCFTRIFGSFLGLGLYYLYLAKNFNKFKTLSDVNNALFIMFKMKHDK